MRQRKRIKEGERERGKRVKEREREIGKRIGSTEKREIGKRGKREGEREEI